MKNLYLKLLTLQKEIGAITKDATNPFFKSKYFDINTLLAELKPILNQHGVIVLQPLTNIDGKPALETIVIDEASGEQITRTCVLPENADPQKMGSTCTYYRRYSLQSLFLLQAEDDDANLASNNHAATVKTPVNATSNGTAPFQSKPKVVGEVCESCKVGHYVQSPSTGKVFCSEKCWTR